MDFSFPPEAEAFRSEVRDFLATNLTEEMIEATHDGTMHIPALHRAMAERGWLSGPVPAALGGGGRSALESVILNEEMQLARAPIDAMGVTVIVAAILLEHGDDHLKQHVVPRLLDGSSLACFGYSEPEFGSDVAAAKTRAERDGDEWLINGAKMWTTMAHIADYVLLLTRTDPDVPKHKGLSFFLVPLNTPGIEIQPVPTMAIERSNATFYDDVRLGDEWRVGDVNGGWSVMKTALKYERGIAGGQFLSPPVIDAAVDWAQNHTRPDGTKPIEDPTVREKLIRALIDVEVCRGFAYHCADLANQGVMFGVEGSMTKLFASESYKRHCRDFHDMMGAEGLLTHESADAHLGGRIEENLRHSPVTTIYGGTSEINRNVVAEGHLGMPRAR
jgi:alkylation response protein AidB-like acyl-CoA dehydrogenase